MINNLEILKPILHFEKDYYVRVIILSRSKDGNLLQKRIGRDLFFGTLESLQEAMPDIIATATEYNARVYIDTVSKRLSSGFLAQIEWERFKVFGIKPQLEAVIIEEDFYGLYDADGYAKEENKIIKSLSEEFNFKPLIIKSSNEGEHWLYKGSELRTLSNSVNNTIIRNKIFIEHAWACLYNPFN